MSGVYVRRTWLLAATAVLAAIHVQAIAQATPVRSEASPPRVVVRADGHRAVAGEPWRFTVRATTADGRPARGTVVLRVLMGGRVADVLGVTRFSGTRSTAYRWSPLLAGARAVLQVTVVAADTATRVGYPVNVVGKTGKPRFRVTLSGGGHAARVGAPWRFVVRAHDAAGAVGGTAVVRIVVGGHISDTLGWFAFDGRLTRSYRWTKRLRGRLALVQVRVVGPGGSRTAGYMVRVR